MLSEPQPLSHIETLSSCAAIFEARAAADPGEELLHVVRFEKGEPLAKPYATGDLLLGASRAASLLSKLGVRERDRVIVALGDPAEFLWFFLAAQGLGAIPVPAPPLGDVTPRAYSERLEAVARDARPAALVLADAAAVDAAPSSLRAGARCCTPADAVAESGAPPPGFHLDRGPEEIAFLQYTSGTTATPRGVVVRQKNLVANVRGIVAGAGIDRRDVVYSWLPLFHDMGLVAGLVLGLVAGIPTYVASPRTFATRPDSWLRAIHRFRATFSPGPNFAFDVLARRLPPRALHGLDLSSWRLAFNGAELVEPDTVQAFVERFRDHGFEEGSMRPAYGLAEATLAVTFPKAARAVRFDAVDRAALGDRALAERASPGDARAVRYASVGTPLADHTVRVIDPSSGNELPERNLGEIVVRGPSVSPGYFDELAVGAPPRDELRTGDLGYVAEGELYIVDRAKDILVVAGRKFAPGDIERTVAEIDGIRLGAVVAFAVRRDRGTEELCIAAGVEPGSTEETDGLRRAIRRVLFDRFGLTPLDVRLVRPSSLPRTSSGKLRRAECRALFTPGRTEGK